MFKNGLYNLLGTIARLALSIASVPLLLRFLGPSDYGLYAILMAIINISVLSEWSICMVLIVFVTQAVAKPREPTALLGNTLRQALVLVVCLAIITATLLWLLSPFMALAFPNLSESHRILLKRGCQLSAIVVFFRLLQQFFIGLEQAHGHYKLLNSIGTIFTISQTVLILVAAYWQKGLLAIISVQAAATAVFLFIHGTCCYQYGWLSPLRQADKNQWDQFPRMLMYSSRTFIGGIGSAFFSQGDRLVVGRLLGLEASGFYAALASVATQIHTLSTIAIQPLVPTLTKLVEQVSLPNSPASTQESLETTISRALKINAILAVGLGSLIMMMAPELSAFLFKHDLSKLTLTSNGLRVIAFIYTLYSLNAVGYYMLLAIKREIVTTMLTLICGSASLLLVGILGHFYGVTGALYGNAGYLLTLLLLVYGFKSFSLRWQLWLNAMWQPLLILISVFGASKVIDSFVNRIVLLIMLSLILCIPLIQEGWQYFIINRRNRDM
ncbi:oligosaccharide flippase family protein [Fibrella aquatica]|uniref:oligosaccharide flippase family protein n=1 Tax=Fibrella aquatica TaxID=3242487 RepID=UPI0035202A83